MSLKKVIDGEAVKCPWCSRQFCAEVIHVPSMCPYLGGFEDGRNAEKSRKETEDKG